MRWFLVIALLAACGADGPPEEHPESQVDVSGEATIGVRGKF